MKHLRLSLLKVAHAAQLVLGGDSGITESGGSLNCPVLIQLKVSFVFRKTVKSSLRPALGLDFANVQTCGPPSTRRRRLEEPRSTCRKNEVVFINTGVECRSTHIIQ